jgi:hypothetical protein
MPVGAGSLAVKKNVPDFFVAERVQTIEKQAHKKPDKPDFIPEIQLCRIISPVAAKSILSSPR